VKNGTPTPRSSSRVDEVTRAAMIESPVYFGGPDCVQGLLRDLLASRIALVPAGGAIDWITYYFRDQRLAADLIEAHRRGVEVRVTLEGHPRTIHANVAVIGQLEAALGNGLRVVRHPLDGTWLGKIARPRLHEKLYCFSHPAPTAFVGSFNPSSNWEEVDSDIIGEIGDHSRAHNVLVELRDPDLVRDLTDHARRLHAARHGPLERLSPRANRSIHRGGHSIHFWPRVRRHPILKFLAKLEPGSRVRIAASHISGRSPLRGLIALAARGVQVEILTEATKRRVPARTERQLSDAGIPLRRLIYEPWIPMHNKFVLVEGPDVRATIFGSFNWSEPSYWLNREIGVVTGDPLLFKVFAERWDQLSAIADRGFIRLPD
jgi:phosphatidylserine/phosphatidylglycerophosphate/cardiolipin synthase-like enzyme